MLDAQSLLLNGMSFTFSPLILHMADPCLYQWHRTMPRTFSTSMTRKSDGWSGNLFPLMYGVLLSDFNLYSCGEMRENMRSPASGPSITTNPERTPHLSANGYFNCPRSSKSFQKVISERPGQVSESKYRLCEMLADVIIRARDPQNSTSPQAERYHRPQGENHPFYLQTHPASLWEDGAVTILWHSCPPPLAPSNLDWRRNPDTNFVLLL